MIQFQKLMLVGLLSAAAATAQDAHWGIGGDFFRGQVPDFIVDRIDELPERPDINGALNHAGLVRFHGNGSPNFAIEYSRMDFDFAGGLNSGSTRQEVRGDGSASGVMFTKFTNFFSTRFVSAGLAFGGGVGKLEANYIRYQVPPGPGVVLQSDGTDRVVPLYQAVAQIDIRPVRWISLSPFYGFRNGMLGGGGAIRIHFRK